MKNPTEECNNAPWAKKTLADYQKARGMLLAAHYAASRFPFDRTLKIVRTEQEWDAIKDEYGEELAYRVDFPMGCIQHLAVNTTGSKEHILPLLRWLRSGGDEAALLLLRPTEDFIPRYRYDGGFSVLFIKNQEVVLEIVGPGFDGKNVTSGQMICEKFRIPWEVAGAAHNMSAETLLNSFCEQIIAPSEYAKLRQRRIKELANDSVVPYESLELIISEFYKRPQEALLDLVRNVVPQLVKRQPKIALEIGHEVYAAQGNFVRGQAHVWEIFSPSRWIRGLCQPINTD